MSVRSKDVSCLDTNDDVYILCNAGHIKRFWCRQNKGKYIPESQSWIFPKSQFFTAAKCLHDFMRAPKDKYWYIQHQIYKIRDKWIKTIIPTSTFTCREQRLPKNKVIGFMAGPRHLVLSHACDVKGRVITERVYNQNKLLLVYCTFTKII